MMFNILIVILFEEINSSPMRLVQNIAENSQFQDIDNYLPKSSDLPRYEYSTFQEKKREHEVVFNLHEKNIAKDDSSRNVSEHEREFPKLSSELAAADFNTSKLLVENYTNSDLDPFNSLESNSTFTNRTSRQEVGNSTGVESQLGTQLEAQEEEENGNMITGLISALLGGLSRPDGSIDVEAITGLLGSLSMQNPDGTYNFMGLTDLVRSFFGGGDDGGGSDIGSFVGGLTGALLQGFANPPGAKGVGKFTGSIVGRLLPSLSAPPLDANGEPQQGLDPFGFVGGFLKTFFNGSSTSVSPGNTTESRGRNRSKYSIFKTIVSTITSIFTASSGSSSSCMPTMLC